MPGETALVAAAIYAGMTDRLDITGALIALRRRERRWRQLARAHHDKALPPSARNS